ncbi:MAG: hypothetical protein ACJAU5_001611 [Maricaulis maris]|jgi:hypothetical protein
MQVGNLAARKLVTGGRPRLSNADRQGRNADPPVPALVKARRRIPAHTSLAGRKPYPLLELKGETAKRRLRRP